MKTSDEIRKEIEILEAEAAGLRARIAEHEKDMKACNCRLRNIVGTMYDKHGELSVAKGHLESALRREEDAKLPRVRVQEWDGVKTRVFVKKTPKSILIRVPGSSRTDRFGFDGYPASRYKGEHIHPEDLAKVLDGTIGA